MTQEPQEESWEEFYQNQEKRAPRGLFQNLIQLVEADGGSPLPGFAIDLGCGDGTETQALLQSGWKVMAVDQSPDAIRRVKTGAQHSGLDRLQAVQADFQEVVLPPADLIYAGLSLPFCPPGTFPGLWRKIEHALRPGKWFAGHFFGDKDSWAGNPDMTFLNLQQVRDLFPGWQIAFWQEVEDDQPSAFEAMKHFHYFEVVARKPI